MSAVMAEKGNDRISLIWAGIEELNFVLSAMSKIIPHHIEFDDLVGEAILEIVGYVDKYDPDHESGASFSTFVSPRIRGSIITYLRKYGGAGFSYIDVDAAANNGFSRVFSDKGVESNDIFSRACASALSAKSLETDERIILELYFSRNQSVRDIAKGACIAASTATRKINAALNKLRVENFVSMRKPVTSSNSTSAKRS